jgi:hypothetical protein
VDFVKLHRRLGRTREGAEFNLEVSSPSEHPRIGNFLRAAAAAADDENVAVDAGATGVAALFSLAPPSSS